MLSAPSSSVSLQEEKRGLQEEGLSEGSSTKSTPEQEEAGTVPINTFGIEKRELRDYSPNDVNV